MKPRLAFLAAAALALFSSDGFPQVIETPRGKIEFAGLERWDLATIQQKLGYESPDRLFFAQHDLTSKLGFADAACVIYLEGGKPYKFLTVLEPQRAGLIKLLPSPPQSLPAPDEWRDLLKAGEERRFVMNGLVDYGGTLRNAHRTGKPLLPDEEKTWFALLQQRCSKKDYNLAVKRIAEDGDYRNRVVAAMILANFADRGQAWRSLMVGLRDPNQPVRIACQQSLSTLTKYVPRTVDWLPVADSIHHLLKGTNVYALQYVLETLLKTNVSPRLSRPLLTGGGDRLLMTFLRATHQKEKALARELLVRLSKQDFGFDERRWGDWINRL